MAFLGKPKLKFGTPTRPSPTAPGTVAVTIEVPLFVEILEKCMIANCAEAANAFMFQIVADIWTTDRSEPIGTNPITPEKKLFSWMWSPNFTQFNKIKGQQLLNASTVTGSPNLFLINLTDSHSFPESTFNEDHGPFPPPFAPPLPQTQDEIFLRVHLSSIFTAWQTIQKIDSDIVTGQFYGP